MNVEAGQLARATSAGQRKARTGIVDVDIHPKASVEDLRPFLSQRW
jgi:hypothetical protein